MTVTAALSSQEPVLAPPRLTDLAAVKSRQRGAWATGNYAVVGTTLQIVGERLAESLDLRAGMRVLDVAAGNGNGTLAAARRFCEVTSTDYVPALLEAGRRRAEAEGQSIRFEEADAENLPYPSGAFDAAMSIFGIMFTPDQERAAAELARVVRPGGRIGLASWTPDSFVGEMFRTIGRFVPPPAGLRSPALWGVPERIEELFAATGSTLWMERRSFSFRYRSTDHWLEQFRAFYGPMNRAFAALDPAGQAALAAELRGLAARRNASGDATMVVPSDYLEVVLERRA